jgi:hypothetical protein
MKAAVAIAGRRDDRHRIVHQPLDMITGGVAGIRPRARQIAALARRNGAIARGCKGRHLRAPAMHGFGEAVEEQDQWRARFADGEGVEGQGGEMVICSSSAMNMLSGASPFALAHSIHRQCAAEIAPGWRIWNFVG